MKVQLKKYIEIIMTSEEYELFNIVRGTVIKIHGNDNDFIREMLGRFIGAKSDDDFMVDVIWTILINDI